MKHPFDVRIIGSVGELLLKRTVDAADDPGFDPTTCVFPDTTFILEQFHINDIYVIGDVQSFQLFKVAEIRPRSSTGKYLNKLMIMQEAV